MKNQKIKIAEYVLSQLGIPQDEKNIKKTIHDSWQNKRLKEQGGLGLTEMGFDLMVKAGFKSYRIKLDEPLIYDNQLILGLDHYINSPYYLTKKEIYVFNETTAIQLILFHGNVKKFIDAKIKNKMLID